MIRVRDAGHGDEAFVVGLVPRFVEHAAADAHSADEVIAGTTRVLREALAAARDGELFWIAEDEDLGRVGFVYATTERDFFTREPYVHVSEIVVAPSGKGVGAALMAAIEDYARERDYRFVSLNVVDENVAAQRFYERRGFTIGHLHYVKKLLSG